MEGQTETLSLTRSASLCHADVRQTSERIDIYSVETQLVFSTIVRVNIKRLVALTDTNGVLSIDGKNRRTGFAKAIMPAGDNTIAGRPRFRSSRLVFSASSETSICQ